MSVKVFTVLSILKSISIEYRISERQFPFQHLKIFLRCPLASVISAEKADISFIIVPLTLMCPLPLPLSLVALTYQLLEFKHQMPKYAFLCIQSLLFWALLFFH